MIIDVDRVRRLIEAQFPQYAALPLEAVQPGGWDNRTFRLGQELSVRLPSAARYAPQVEKEHRWLPRLASTLPLPIPIPLAVGKPAEGYPWHWSIYRWLEGQPATAGRIADPTAFAGSIASFLTALHRIDAAGGPAAGNHNFIAAGILPLTMRKPEPLCRRSPERSMLPPLRTCGRQRSRPNGAPARCGSMATWPWAIFWSEAESSAP